MSDADTAIIAGAVLGKASLLAAALAGWVYPQSVSSLAEDRDQAHTAASQWIADVDPKHRAWAAELIAQHQLEDLHPELVTQLETFQALGAGVSQPSADELTLEAIVDAIIKLQLRVPLRRVIIKHTDLKRPEPEKAMTFGQFWRERFLPMYKQTWKLSSRATQVDNIERYLCEAGRAPAAEPNSKFELQMILNRLAQ